MNDYQKESFSYLAEFQERSVQIAMSNYKEGDDFGNASQRGKVAWCKVLNS